MLRVFPHIPDGLLDCEPHQLRDVLGGPTLIELSGRREPALFISILLHGNESTGWLAVRELLRKYQDLPLPRSLALFIGNVDAAAQDLRHLEGQPDYNRVWPGSETDGTPEHAMMAELMQRMRVRGVFASIDVHNNTGLNPHYACINRLESDFFHLATLFSRKVVYFIRPVGVQSLAFSELCPAVTVESGKPGDETGVRHVQAFIEGALHLSTFPEPPVPEHDIDLFHTKVTVKIPEAVQFHFAGDKGNCAEDARFCLDPELERLNFREVLAGTPFGCITSDMGWPLQAIAEDGEDVTDRYFQIQGKEVQLARPVMPSMLTLDERVIRQDCLCYLMERLPLD